MASLYSLLFVILLSSLIPKCESYIDDDGDDIVTLSGEEMGAISMTYVTWFKYEIDKIYIKGDSLEDIKKKIPEIMKPIEDTESIAYPAFKNMLEITLYTVYLSVLEEKNSTYNDDPNYILIWDECREKMGNMLYKEGDKVPDIMRKMGPFYQDNDKRDVTDLIRLAEKIFLEHQYPIKEPVRLAGNVYPINKPITFDVNINGVNINDINRNNEQQHEDFDNKLKEIKDNDDDMDEFENMLSEESRLGLGSYPNPTEEMYLHKGERLSVGGKPRLSYYDLDISKLYNTDLRFSTCNTIWDTRIRNNISIHDPVEIFDKEMEEYLEIIPVLINNANNTMIKWNETERVMREKGWFNRCDKLDLEEIEYDYGSFHVFLEYDWFRWLKEYEIVDGYFKKIKTKPCPYMGGYYGKESENWWIVRFRSDIKEHIVKVEGQLPWIKGIVDKDPKTLKFYSYSPAYRRMRERYRSSKEVDELICYTNIMDYIIEQVNINKDDTEIDRLIKDVRKTWEDPQSPGNCGPYYGIFDYDCNNLPIVAGF